MNAGKSVRRRFVGAWSVAQICSGVMLAVWMLDTDTNGATPELPETAKQLVDGAREAAMAGDSARQFALLRQAVRIEPNDHVARWQLGQIQVDDRWMTVEEAQRHAAAQPAQARYRELRAEHGESLEGQLALARWCRRNNLNDEARFHWASVLSVQPGNEEALRSLDVRWHNGQLESRDEVAKSKERIREWKRTVKQWASSVSKWERAVTGDDVAAREAALAEIRALKDADAIPAMEKLTLAWTRNGKVSDECRQISLAFAEALAAMPAPTASVSLARHAVFSLVPDVRSSAINGLKTRPLHEYVPLLLGGLSMPIESSFSVTTDSDGSVHYRHSLYREGPETDWSADLRRSAMQHDLGGRRYTYDVATKSLELGPPTESPVVVAAKKAVVATRHQSRYGNAAAVTESQVWQANQASEAINSLIIPVLIGATGKEIRNPKDWWDWWLDDNEYYSSEDRPVDQHYDSHTESYSYGYPALDIRYPDPPPPRRYSCFAKGTLVWTKTGQQPIESLELGDLVLAQNVDTGELAYKPVIARTVRPPSPILKLSLDGEALLTTRGHPFWVAGVGWRMAKELGDAAVLHAVTGSAPLAAVEPAGELEAYNLVVADFNTYFVGESGVLVHDNTPRRPTQSTLPGLSTK